MREKYFHFSNIVGPFFFRSPGLFNLKQTRKVFKKFSWSVHQIQFATEVNNRRCKRQQRTKYPNRRQQSSYLTGCTTDSFLLLSPYQFKGFVFQSEHYSKLCTSSLLLLKHSRIPPQLDLNTHAHHGIPNQSKRRISADWQTSFECTSMTKMPIASLLNVNMRFLSKNHRIYLTFCSRIYIYIQEPWLKPQVGDEYPSEAFIPTQQTVNRLCDHMHDFFLV